jgi:hypothetical protein
MSNLRALPPSRVAVGQGFGAWFARISVQRPAGKIGVSPSPPQGVQARYKLLKKGSLRVFHSGRWLGRFMTGRPLAEMGNCWVFPRRTEPKQASTFMPKVASK